MFFSFLVLSEKFFAGTFSKGTGYLNWAVRVFGEDLPHSWGRARTSIIPANRRVVKSRPIEISDSADQDLSSRRDGRCEGRSGHYFFCCSFSISFSFCSISSIFSLGVNFGNRRGDLYPHSPRRGSRGMHRVAVELRGHTHWLESDLHQSSEATPERHRPDVSTACFPVGGDDWRNVDVPTFFML